MAKITADSEYMAGGVPVKVKKIPYGTRWKKNYGTFFEGDLYKADRLMTKGTGKVLGITIHNTDDSADAATYTLATFNQNMGSARVHFYVDDREAWQNLELNEVGWHAGTGDTSLGNDSYIAIEIIMGKNYTEKDRLAEENGASLTAYLLHVLGLSVSDIVTHKHWNGKECPLYILPHWNEFLALVTKKYKELEKQKNPLDNTPDEYAKEAIKKATEKGLLRGNTEGNLLLHSPLSRQDLFVILERIGVI